MATICFVGPARLNPFATFHPTVANTNDVATNNMINVHGFINNENAYDIVNQSRTSERFHNVGILAVGDDEGQLNSQSEFPSNKTDGTHFGAQWMNFTVYLEQNGRFRADVTDYDGMMSNTHFIHGQNERYPGGFHFIDRNTQPIAAGVVNTQWYPRIDMHFTDFIEVPPEDILTINNINSKGFKKSQTTLTGSDYRNGNGFGGNIVPREGTGDRLQGSGRVDANPDNALDTDFYFYKGLNDSDCIQLMVDLGLV